MEMPQVARPIPRRAFELTPASTDSSHPPSPATEAVNADHLSGQKPDSSPSRTRSILNLTSSTLFGIYSSTGSDDREELSTPWGTGAQTPSQRRSIDDATPRQPSSLTWTRDADKPRLNKKKGFHGFFIPLLLQTVLLSAFGIAYGAVVTHLHKRQLVTPVPVPDIERNSLSYQLSWGVFGIVLGNALPLLDSLWEKAGSRAMSEDQTTENTQLGGKDASATDGSNSSPSYDSGLGPIWYSAVRSMGVFVGIAFAVRRLPWQSTLQVALTLALANPVLWYLIDRSLPGFTFSAAVSTIGTTILLLVDPNFVPLPAIHQPVASEQFGVYIWLASILFCTSICFGAIGRRLQL